jgi:hypothetical protein
MRRGRTDVIGQEMLLQEVGRLRFNQQATNVLHATVLPFYRKSFLSFSVLLDPNMNCH